MPQYAQYHCRKTVLRNTPNENENSFLNYNFENIIKVKTDELDYVKITNFCASKNKTINRIKMQHV